MSNLSRNESCQLLNIFGLGICDCQKPDDCLKKSEMSRWVFDSLKKQNFKPATNKTNWKKEGF